MVAGEPGRLGLHPRRPGLRRIRRAVGRQRDWPRPCWAELEWRHRRWHDHDHHDDGSADDDNHHRSVDDHDDRPDHATTTTVPPTTTTTTTTDPPPTTTTTDPPPTTTTTTLPPNHGNNGNGNGNGNGSRTGVNRLKGYWLTTSNGGIFTFGDAPALGSASGMALNKPIVAMASTPDRQGYWMVASDGGIFTFGDAGFFGSTGGTPLNKPIVGMASTADGQGYWLVASDGGIFAFGDAALLRLDRRHDAEQADRRHGGHARRTGATGWWPPTAASSPSATPPSTARPAACTLNKPIVGMAATPDGAGYWLVGLRWWHLRLRRRPVLRVDRRHSAEHSRSSAWRRPPTGAGYWLVAPDGGIFAFGDAQYYGSAGSLHLSDSTVAIS